MIDFIYSDETAPNKMIIWDLGRRCNFDCSYCTAWMHSTTAPINKIDQYKKTANFIHKYFQIYKKYHKKDWHATISFTGGEPTVNPAFYDLVEYLKTNYPYFRLNLTTNGTWSARKGKFLMDNMHSITVSYHCEGTEKQKKLIQNNILWLKQNIKEKWRLRINVMMHMDYFEETTNLIENFLKPNDINFTPRVIGDDSKFRTEWFKDSDGKMRRTTHKYTEEQMFYLKNHWENKNKEANISAKNKIIPIQNKNTDIKISEDGLARKMGRMCCGGRCMTVKQDNIVSNAMFIEQSNFKDYNCMINWFFLHIEEDRDAVYHHQTCMARFSDAPKPELDQSKFGLAVKKFTDNIGPITTISKSDIYLNWLEDQFSLGKQMTMICPNTHCGCGICIAKAHPSENFEEIKNKFVKI